MSGRRVHLVLYREFDACKPIRPVGLTPITEDARILFELLVCVFRLSVSLWSTRRGQALRDAQEWVQSTHEVEDKLRAAVRNYDEGKSFQTWSRYLPAACFDVIVLTQGINRTILDKRSTIVSAKNDKQDVPQTNLFVDCVTDRAQRDFMIPFH